jgi:hypothetical protein
MWICSPRKFRPAVRTAVKPDLPIDLKANGMTGNSPPSESAQGATNGSDCGTRSWPTNDIASRLTQDGSGLCPGKPRGQGGSDGAADDHAGFPSCGLKLTHGRATSWTGYGPRAIRKLAHAALP